MTQTTDLVARLRLLANHQQATGFWPDETMRNAAYEIDRLRDLVRALHEPAWAELGLACGDIDEKFRDVLDRALSETEHDN